MKSVGPNMIQLQLGSKETQTYHPQSFHALRFRSLRPLRVNRKRKIRLEREERLKVKVEEVTEDLRTSLSPRHGAIFWFDLELNWQLFSILTFFHFTRQIRIPWLITMTSLR